MGHPREPVCGAHGPLGASSARLDTRDSIRQRYFGPLAPPLRSLPPFAVGAVSGLL